MLLTVRHAAAILGVSETTVYDACSSGAITHVRIGRSVRIPEEAASEYVAARTVPAHTARRDGEAQVPDFDALRAMLRGMFHSDDPDAPYTHTFTPPTRRRRGVIRHMTIEAVPGEPVGMTVEADREAMRELTEEGEVSEPTTEAGKALLRSDFDTTGWGPTVVRQYVTEAVTAIEREAVDAWLASEEAAELLATAIVDRLEGFMELTYAALHEVAEYEAPLMLAAIREARAK